MQDGHRTSINSASLTADEVARRSFPTVRKGFDPTDVRMFLDSVAEQLQTLYDREDDLRRRLARAEHQAAHPEMDEATLTAVLGHETTKVLRSAHDAAGDMKARAEEGASHVIHQAHEEAARIRAEGERAASDRASEAEVTAARIRSGAAAEADSVVEAARQEAQAMLAGVQEDCRGMVREAQEVRARVLADLVRRRRALYGQVEHLRGGRQNLVEALREARRSFDHILETLQRDFDPGAAAQPSAEDGVGELGAPQPNGGGAMSPEPRAVEGAGRVLAPMREPPRRPGPGDAGDPGRGSRGRTAASVDPGRPGPPPTTIAVVGDRAADSGPASTDEAASSPAARLAEAVHSAERGTGPEVAAPEGRQENEQAVARRRSGFRIIRRPRHPPADEGREKQSGPGDAPTTEAPADDEGIRILESAPDTARTPNERSDDPGGPGGGPPVAEARDASDPTPPARPRGRSGGRHRAPGSSAVDDLFAKIKAGRSPSAEKARSDATEDGEAGPGGRPESEEAMPAAGRAPDDRTPTVGAAPSAPAVQQEDEAPAAEAETAAPDGEPDTTAGPSEQPEPEENAEATENAGEERESGPEASFRRRRDDAIAPITVALSRRLKRALQDDQNDLLDRLRSRGKRPLDEILPPVAEHQEHFRRAGVELLGRAELAGTSFLREGREGDGRANGSGVERDSIALAGELAIAITDPLRRRLERSLGDAADPDDASLVDNVGAAYREWKGPRIERVAGDHVVAAFSQGELGVAREGTALRWIVDDGDERCPDCDDNALAGPLPRGERYPTGQAHPPAHSGCRCLLAPLPA